MIFGLLGRPSAEDVLLRSLIERRIVEEKAI
jgi:hypothetical protein